MIRRSTWMSIVAMVALVGAALFAATAPPVAAQADAQTLDVTMDYRLVPDDPDKIGVELTVENPEDFDEPITIRLDDSDQTVQSNRSFVAGEDGKWHTRRGADSASITYTTSPDAVRDMRGDDGSWMIVREAYLDIRDDENPPLEVSETHTTDDGQYVPPRGYLYLREGVEKATVSTDDGAVTVVGAPEQMADGSVEVVAEQVANVTDEIDNGATDQHVTAFAVPHIDGASGRVPMLGNPIQFTEESESVHDTGSTWYHEQVHVADDLQVHGSEMQWFSEAYADYGALLYGLQAGHQELGDYRSGLESWSGNRVDLSDASSWRSTDYEEEYNQGSRVLAAIDYRMRTETNGEATFEDLTSVLQDEYVVGEDDFAQVVGDVVNESGGDGAAVAEDVETWVTTAEPVLEDGVWSYEEHEDVFGPAANFETNTTVTVSDDATDRSVTAETIDSGVLTVTTDETLHLEVTVENTGNRSGTYGVVLPRSTADRLLDTESVRTDLAPGETETVTISQSFDEPRQETVNFEDLGVIDVTVVDQDATVASAHSAGEEPAEPLLLEDGADLAITTGHVSTSQRVTVETLDGDVVVDRPVDDDTPTVIDGDAFDRSTTYEVTFTDENGDVTRYVSTLEPVNGTVPVDRNGDGLHRDVNGDGAVTNGDVTLFFQHQHTPKIDEYPDAYDFDGDGNVGQTDVKTLFEYVSG